MFHCRTKLVLSLVGLCLAVCFQGCATGDKRVNILYQPVAEVTGGSGTIYLVQGVKPAPAQAAAVQWILGDVTKDDGTELGKVMTDIPPAGLVLDALKEELVKAGYRAVTADVMPAGTDKGLILTDAVLSLNDTHSPFKDEAACSLKMGLQQWRRGAARSNSQYQAEYAESAVTDRDRLPAKVLQKTLQLLMTRAVPEVVRIMETAPAASSRP
jgi:hypothetical protein